ncbi:hypothetical protein VUR80DRAFT_342 [Thermomyces stellatus]
MATSLAQNPYAAQQVASYGYVQMPQPPPSPPIDDSKCSLPSISNLLGLADAGSPTSETSPQTQQQQQQAQSPQQAPAEELPQPAQQQQPQPQPQPQQQQQMQQQAQQQVQMQLQQQAMPSQVASPAPSGPDTRPSSAHYPQPSMMRGNMPPTPPMGTDASFDGYPSPVAKPINGMSVVPGPNYYYETTPPLEEPRNMSPALGRMPLQTSYPQQSFGSPYMSQSSLPPYYPPMQPTPPPQPQISGLYYQRPLPQQFPPMPVSIGLGPTSGPNPWQHHHYIAPSSATSFPQSQDRYICPTCNKAFSRPSSLRIHSHSHTGEKPYKCPHPGCGKAFSVRSNMKRHERGCHNYDSSSSSVRS